MRYNDPDASMCLDVMKKAVKYRQSHFVAQECTYTRYVIKCYR